MHKARLAPKSKHAPWLCQPLQFLANKTWPTWAWLKMIRRYRFISCTAGVLLQLEISFDDGLLVSTMAPCCIITALAFVWPSSVYLSSDFNEKGEPAQQCLYLRDVLLQGLVPDDYVPQQALTKKDSIKPGWLDANMTGTDGGLRWSGRRP